MSTESYQDLIVWQKGLGLVKQIYQITGAFPGHERFGLISQMRRSAVSIPSNIAEGQARRTTGEFVQFLSHSEGSLAELHTQLIIAVQLRYCRPDDVKAVFESITEIRRMLNSLRRKLLAIQRA